MHRDVCVCVLFILNRSFYPSTSRKKNNLHPGGDISHTHTPPTYSEKIVTCSITFTSRNIQAQVTP